MSRQVRPGHASNRTRSHTGGVLMRRPTVSVFATTALLAATMPAFGATGSLPPDVRTVLGDRVERTAEGLFRVGLDDGTWLTTHGDDPRPSHGAGIGPGDPERAPVCASDFYQHVLYGRPASAPDRYASVVGTIRGSMRRINALLNEEALESGGKTADYKVLCEPGGEIRVDSFVNAGSSSFGSVVNAARAAGFNLPNVDYTVFYDSSGGACGIGSFFFDDRLVADNPNNGGGSYGVNYAGCWEMVPMHENGHNQGAVQFWSPFSTGAAHCDDENDVMCYSDGGPRDRGIFFRCIDQMHFDCEHDDYFDADPEVSDWLADHWNMGSPLNRFIVFGTPPPGARPTVDAGEGHTVVLSAHAHGGATATDPDGDLAFYRWYCRALTPTTACPAEVLLSGPVSGGLTPVQIPGPTVFFRGQIELRLTVMDAGGRAAVDVVVETGI